MQRRIPKRGFTNIFRIEFGIVNVQDLERFDAGATVNRDSLIEIGLLASKYKQVKILGNGEISKALTVSVDKLSESARKKIEAAGGKVEVIAFSKTVRVKADGATEAEAEDN